MENLTVQTFKEKVFNYTENTQKADWKFIGKKPCVIDFYADWCGPCRMVAPILEELSTENQDVDFYKIDTDAQPELTQVFGIRNIPAVLFIPMTGQPTMVVGAQQKSKFQQAINSIIL
jgi:thioredoxin